MSQEETITLKASFRQETGKNVARRLRAAGQLPVTVYGGGQEPAMSTVAKRELAALIRHHGRGKVITLDMEGTPVSVKIAQLQLDPVRDTVIHADFIRV
jgi:large subunit ribosomal protein L25